MLYEVITGRYRRWFTFGVPMQARKRTSLRVRYVARVGRSLRLFLTNIMAFRFPGLYTWADYWIDYVLHTGSAWAGPIGKGEVVLYAEGRHVITSYSIHYTKLYEKSVRSEPGPGPRPG